MILFGTPIANEIASSLKQEVSLLSQTHRPPKLSVLLVGDNRASQIYIAMKQKNCSHVGILSETIIFPATVSEKELLDAVNQLNNDTTVDGILIQLPLPPSLDPQKILSSISPKKDVDGFHPLNMGKLLLGHTDGFIPCTPLGIQKMLHYYDISTEGKYIVIVGRSNIVGKPLAALLMQKHPRANATVTLCHSMSRDLHGHTQRADILIAACGISKFITESMVKEGAYVIDVGIHHIQDTQGNIQLTGDVDFENVQGKVAGITPVPKGVGPMTVAMLLYNTIKSYKCNI
jgi:methylenetetrahydrofolate dehydrogenase (NADP+)/methenyltetrahydrofolate cyclohydrolase